MSLLLIILLGMYTTIALATLCLVAARTSVLQGGFANDPTSSSSDWHLAMGFFGKGTHTTTQC